jgi:hypothetical protein
MAAVQPMPWFKFINSSDPTLYQNLVGQYDFTGNTTDTGGLSNNGTVQGGVSATTDRRLTSNAAYSFNGSTGYISTTNLITNPQVYSINVWFNTSTSTPGTLAGFGDTQTGTPSNFDRILWLDSSGGLNFSVNTGSLLTVSSAATGYNNGAWHMVTFVMSATSGMTLYIDSTSVGTDANKVSQGYNGYWRIGQMSLSGLTSPTGGYFNGKLDDIKIYSIALSSTQVSELYAL